MGEKLKIAYVDAKLRALFPQVLLHELPLTAEAGVSVSMSQQDPQRSDLDREALEMPGGVPLHRSDGSGVDAVLDKNRQVMACNQ